MLSGNRSPNLNEYFATVTIAAAAVGPNKASPVPKTPLLTTWLYGQNITEGSWILCGINYDPKLPAALGKATDVFMNGSGNPFNKDV